MSLPTESTEVKQPEARNSIGFSRTARDGWRADSVKLYWVDGESAQAVRHAILLMQQCDEAARAVNGGGTENGSDRPGEA